MVRSSVIAAGAAAVLLGGSGAEAFVPHAATGALSRGSGSCVSLASKPASQRASSVPALRMGLGDMFGKAFENNPNIPTAPATGPGSPGFSKPKPMQEKVEEPEPQAAVATAPPPAVPPPALWQEATDPATGNPYWYNVETGETSWNPPASTPPAPAMAEETMPMAEEIDENTVIQLKVPEEEDNGPTGPSLERQLINLNKFLVNGLIDQEEYDEQAAEIKAQMPKGPVIDADSMARPFSTTTIKWGALVDTKIPDGWVEGRDYDRQNKLEEGTLVGVSRSDGSVRFGQVVKKSGYFYEDFWTVVVSMNDDGTPNAKRVEEGVMLMRPTQTGLQPVLEAMPKIQVQEKDISEALAAKKDKGFFGNMFAAPVYEGGTAPSESPQSPAPQAAAAPPKAQVPAGIIPKATPPAGGIPTAVPPAGVVPPTPAPEEKKTSEWI